MEKSEKQESKGLTKNDVLNIWNEICGTDGREFSSIIYLNVSGFKGSNGKEVNVRLYMDPTEKGKYVLFLNDGDADALLELRDKLSERGVSISRVSVQGARKDAGELTEKLNKDL